MNAAPLAKMGLITMEVNLILAGLIGFGFGFMLERAGFGSAHRLVGQWYMRDWSVFKVMFTGVVTALFGVLILNGLGLMSFEALYLNKTYWGAQIIGGLVMGAGFVIGGYCPGTSFVALASGKLDALFYILGMSFGVLVFSEGWDYFETLQNLGASGRLTLNEWLGLNPWLIAVVLLVVAIIGYRLTTALENKLKQ